MKDLFQTLHEKGHMEMYIGYDKTSHNLVTLKEYIENPEMLEAHENLSEEEKKQLVMSRMKAGEWGDMYIDDEYVDLDRALAEIDKESEMGKGLMRNTLRAIEMIKEDIDKYQSKL